MQHASSTSSSTSLRAKRGNLKQRSSSPDCHVAPLSTIGSGFCANLIVTALLLALALPASAQRGRDVAVTASVNATTIGEQDFVIYTIAVDGSELPGVETPSVPTTRGLALVSPYPSTERQVSVVGHAMQQRLAFRWTFRPTGTGTAQIGAARVRADDRIYETEALTVEVVTQANRPSRSNPAGARPNSGAQDDEPAQLTRDQAFIRASASKRSAYVGEQVVVTYTLFFDPRVQFRQIRLADSWDAAGFWREDLDVDDSPIPQRQVVDGIQYSTIVLKRVSLFATRAGELTVEPFRVATEAVVPPSRTRDPFGSLWGLRGRTVDARIASNPLRLDIQRLPSGAPDGFGGAVGQFRMGTSVDRTSLETGQSASLNVQVSGDGNLATLDPPTLQAPGTVEVYRPSVDLNPTRSGSRLYARVAYDYALVPRTNGTVEIPPVRFSYFDPSARAYRTLTGDGTQLIVTGEPITTRAALPPDALAPIAERTTLVRTDDRTPLHRQVWPYALTVLPLLLFAGAFVAGRRRHALAADPLGARRKRAHPVAQRVLKEADAALAIGDVAGFYAKLEASVLGFVGGRLHLSERGLTRTKLAEHLDRAGVDTSTRDALLTLLTRCDQARFAPVPPPAATRAGDRDMAAALLGTLADTLPS